MNWWRQYDNRVAIVAVTSGVAAYIATGDDLCLLTSAGLCVLHAVRIGCEMAMVARAGKGKRGQP